MTDMPSQMSGSNDHTCHTSGALIAPESTATTTATEPDQDGTATYHFRRPRATILVLEDDRAILWMTTRALTSQNYEAISSATVEDALGWLNRVAVDLIIADLHLGAAAAMQRVFDAAHSQRIPLIVASGDTSAETQKRALRQGAIAFLTKPFEMDELFDLIIRCLSDEQP